MQAHEARADRERHHRRSGAQAQPPAAATSSAATACLASRTSAARPTSTGSPATAGPTGCTAPSTATRSSGGAAPTGSSYWSGDSSSTAPDRILDFSRAQGDRIDLAGVDAYERVDGDQAFRFVGQNPFTGVGQLRFFQQNGDTVVEANTTDLTGGAELRIVVDPLFTPQAGDFVL